MYEKKEFTIPPVVFPSGGNPSTTGGPNFQHRRIPTTVPFYPSNPTSIPFDVGAPPPSLYGGVTFSSTSTSDNLFSDEPPLLEELEIDPALIYRKTISLLNPVRLNSAIHDSADLSGPILYYASFCLFQLLAGKLQFGVILGWIVVSSVLLYTVFNMLEGRTGNLDLYRCVSLVGYSLLPILIFSAVSLLCPAGGAVRFVAAVMVVWWSTRVCSRLMVEGSWSGSENFGLIAYPCMLIFALFSMLVLF